MCGLVARSVVTGFAVMLAATAALQAQERRPIAKIDNLPSDVARSINACWRAPNEGDEITLRMSFRRDGTIFGSPRIAYMKASGGEDGRADLANSIFAALKACTPLRFTPALGAAIAGRIFLIRFVALRREERAAAWFSWSSQNG